MNFEALDWRVLDRLRATFLGSEFTGGAYWRDRADLEHYDATFGERIGWKWDAVLRELRELRDWRESSHPIAALAAAPGWRPPRARLLDWGCGSGVAGRRVLAAFGPGAFTGVLVHDRSLLAMAYAREKIREHFPGTPVEAPESAWLEQPPEEFVLCVSHVWNELPEADRARLVALARRASAVLWVEPGTHAVARGLQALRDGFTDRFRVIAPCTHSAPCGLLAAGNERHWCHHFAPPPPEVFGDSDWVRFAHRAGIDLRSLPYSFLVLDARRTGAPEPADAAGGGAGAGVARVLGEPRVYKGFARVTSCTAEGVRELEFQKREDPALFRRWKDGEAGRRYRWTLDGARIRVAEPLDPPPPADPDQPESPAPGGDA